MKGKPKQPKPRAESRERMTATEATTFGKFSIFNAATLTDAAVARGCACQPYADWYTFQRWLAQGRVVKRGEHGVKLAIFRDVPVDKDDPAKGTKSIPWGTTVFCRCQTTEIAAADVARAA